MFAIFQIGPLYSTSLSLPSLNTIVQLIFGVGEPDALQNNTSAEPSRTVWSWLTLVSLAWTNKNSL